MQFLKYKCMYLSTKRNRTIIQELFKLLTTLSLLLISIISPFSISQIYDPRLTTTKPPERRESVLPWHSTDNEEESYVQTTSPSSKWYQSQDSITAKSGIKNWSPWRKTSDSGIEQRTQIDIPQQVPEQISEKIPEQQRNFEFDNLEQQESPKFPLGYGVLTGVKFDENYEDFKDESKYRNRGRPQNEIDFEHKHPSRNDETKKTHIEFENDDLYEGVATDSTVIKTLFQA